MEQAKVFSETYQKYLEQIGQIDYLTKVELLGCTLQQNAILIPLYDRNYLVSDKAITEVDGGEVNVAVKVILSKYVLTCNAVTDSEDDPLMTYRDFKGSSPLVSYFTQNSNKIIETTFSGQIETLSDRATAIGGERVYTEGYDCSFVFHALPRIPVMLNFNDKDELFPATCSVLYRQSAERYLDMECLAMTGTLLAGKLIQLSSLKDSSYR